MKDIYELTADEQQPVAQKIQELVLDLVGEGWYVTGGYRIPADMKSAVPLWEYTANDPAKVKETFTFKQDNIVVPLLDRAKFKVFTPQEYAEYQSIFGGN